MNNKPKFKSMIEMTESSSMDYANIFVLMGSNKQSYKTS